MEQTTSGGITDRQADILDFERQWWKHDGVKAASIQTSLGVSASQYYQELSEAIDAPAAMAYDPLLVRRLQRQRTARRRSRSADRFRDER